MASGAAAGAHAPMRAARLGTRSLLEMGCERAARRHALGLALGPRRLRKLAAGHWLHEGAACWRR